MSLRIYGNRPLKTLPGQATRPTSARVREALFNIWQEKLPNSRWLDLCAGSGAIGAEALCRGASLVIGVEQSNSACALIRENWQPLAQPSQVFQVLRGDVVPRLKALQGKQFDCIYFDPPYTSDLYEPVLEAIVQRQLLAPLGEVAVEHRPRQRAITIPPGLEICREKMYGNTVLTFLCLQDEAIPDDSDSASLAIETPPS